jgi:KDO2-lipid IV(A) lauroyltransferase
MRLLGAALYAFLWTLGWLIYLLPFQVKNFIAWGISKLWFYLFPFRLKIILHNISLVFPREKEESQMDFRRRCYNLAKKNTHHMVLSFIEVLERWHWNPKRDLGKRFVVEGEENINFHLQNPKEGFFCLTAHLGNWELITWVGLYLKLRLSIITRFLRNPFFDELWRRSRNSFGLELLEESGSGLSIIRAIRRGRSIGFIFDQHTGEPHGIESEFLSHKAWSPRALAIMTAKLKVPVIPSYVYRDKLGVNHVVIEKDIGYCAESTPEAIRYHVAQCNAKIGEWVRKHPEQYLWMHRRFKNIYNYKQNLPWS